MSSKTHASRPEAAVVRAATPVPAPSIGADMLLGGMGMGRGQLTEGLGASSPGNGLLKLPILPPANVATYTPAPGGLDFSAVPTLVVRIIDGPTASSPPTIVPLPNLQWTSISFRQGAEPPQGEFHYTFGTIFNPPGAPRRLEDVFPFAAQGPYVVQPDDRIGVLRYFSDGDCEYLFDGYAHAADLSAGRDGESVPFRATGRPIRLWDEIVGGAVVRRSHLLTDPGTADAPHDRITDRKTNFNPDGLASCTLDDFDTPLLSGLSRPAFTDPLIVRDPAESQKWSLERAVRYLLTLMDPTEAVVHYQTQWASLRDLLGGKVPKLGVGGGFFDPDDPSTYTLEDILCPDFDATRHPFPVAIAQLIEPFNLSYRFELTTLGGNTANPTPTPRWDLIFFRKDTEKRAVSLRLARAGTPSRLVPPRNQAAQIQLSRDSSQVVNAFYAETKEVAYEASFILVPEFPTYASDLDRLDDFRKGSANFTLLDNATRYRFWSFGEAGDRWYDLDAQGWRTKPTPLDAVFTRGGISSGEDRPKYVESRRPGSMRLFSLDALGKPQSAKLHVSSDYRSAVRWTPEVWNPKVTPQNWVECTQGGWQIRKDRLGIEITVSDPNKFTLSGPGHAAASSGQNLKSGKLRLVQAFAPYPTIDPGEPPVVFRLTCVIRGDQGLPATADKRSASPTRFTITRMDDVRDRYTQEVIGSRSYLNAGKPERLSAATQDDLEEATAHAEARRAAHECPRIAGSAVLPWLSTALPVGSPVTDIAGRDASLRITGGGNVGEAAQLPIIIGVTLRQNANEQTTEVLLSDRRADPANTGHNR